MLILMSDTRDVALYYPGVIWQDASWVKSLALFFDEVALLVPDYMRDRPFVLDPSIATGLEGAGLLRILSPEELIDKEAVERLASAMADVLANGVLDDLPPEGPFQELSWSRLGGRADSGLARMLYEELHQRGLAEGSRDGASIPLHPLVRNLVLVLLAQILRESGPRLGLNLSPATDQHRVHAALAQLLGASGPGADPSTVVEMDLDFVGPDLDPVPLDEVLDFRAAHGPEFRAYARRMRSVVREMESVDPDERRVILSDRLEELREAGETLRRGPLKALGMTAGIGLGLAAGVVGATGEDGALAGILGASAAAVAGVASWPTEQLTPYSYLFAIRRQFA
jgi:hypothetical protein